MVKTKQDLFKIIKILDNKKSITNAEYLQHYRDNNKNKLLHLLQEEYEPENLNDMYFLYKNPTHYIVKQSIIDKKIYKKINDLSDLIDLINENANVINISYNINIKLLDIIKPELEDINNMVGLKKLKMRIVDQILYLLQGFHKISKDSDYLHTVIYGPPGTGKTEIAEMMGKIYCKLDILKKNIFKKVVRSDLVAGYLGQTAIKTKSVINECLGGVLFIDEAYSLGCSGEKKDSFAKECIDTLCEALSNNRDELMVIITGYKDALEENFFNLNPGLDSRFTWRFEIDKYTSKELYLILKKKIKDSEWQFENENVISESWFETNYDYFKNYGRDIESFITKIKISHSKRIFSDINGKKTYITKEDIDDGFELYKEMQGDKKEVVDNVFSFYT